MLKGIDVSHHNRSISIQRAIEHVDFIIAKATEGYSHVDDKFKEYLDLAHQHHKLMGAYHYVNWKMESTGYMLEGDNFISNVKSAFGDLPILLAVDFEEKDMFCPEGRMYLINLIKYIQHQTGITPLLYASESVLQPSYFPLNTLKDMNVGLWVAKYRTIKYGDGRTYPYPYNLYDDPRTWQYSAVDGTINVRGTVAIRQISSRCRLYKDDMQMGNPLDVDVAYMTSNAWMRYARPFDY